MPESQTDIVLGVLNAVEENSQITQRTVAKDLGVALGLVNSYLKRCIKKGYVKIRHAPANRYSYYLTPTGFSEKSRLTTEYLLGSFNFFRNARQECARILRQCEERGHQKIILSGATDLAEIVFLCTQEYSVEIVGVFDPQCTEKVFLGLPVFADLKNVDHFDAIVVTSLSEPQDVYNGLISVFPVELVYTPSILGISRRADAEKRGEQQ